MKTTKSSIKSMQNAVCKTLLVGVLVLGYATTTLAQQDNGGGGFATNPFSNSTTSSGTTQELSNVKVGVMSPPLPDGGDGTDLPVDGGVLLLFTIAVGIAYKTNKSNETTASLL